MSSATIKTSHRLVKTYYTQLGVYEHQGVGHESAVRTAFMNLLADSARGHQWTLIPELSMKVGGKTIRPDGTLRDDEWNLHRGYWEAKDTRDDLDDEIRKKIDLGYPLLNTIFEDSRRGVLYQNDREIFRANLGNPTDLVDLLNQFYNHVEPDYLDFERAVVEFKDRVPQAAVRLVEKIRESHDTNDAFKVAFGTFFELCRASLNPNISRHAVDEMLVQHLLTERVFDKVFKNREFVNRNVIAVELEKVIGALVVRSFDRNEFLQSLNPFYAAMERAAANVADFGQKQQFLNSVYERFFQGYSVKVADTHGIVYTPQEVVDFMCSSVEEVISEEFGKKLGDPGIQILDPCTGTGNFVVNLLRRVPRRSLGGAYRSQFFANEVMLLPYYIAAMNIEHEFYELTGQYEPFGGMCFVDTLDLAEADQRIMPFMTEENAARVNRQKESAITVIIGNPPYNAHQVSENDNNRNRVYDVIDARVRETYVKSSKASLRSALSDAYVRFFRWATDRLAGRPGVVCFISNNSFLRGKSFDGFRQHLLRDFDRIYHIDLKGDARTSGEGRKKQGGNIFSDQIRVGVGITVLVRTGKPQQSKVSYFAAPDYWTVHQKEALLSTMGSLEGVRWEDLTPGADGRWFSLENAVAFGSMTAFGSKESKSATAAVAESIFKVYSSGIKTNADNYVYSFNPDALASRMRGVVEDFNSQLDRWNRSGQPRDIEQFIHVDESVHKWIRKTKRSLVRGHHAEFSESNIRSAQYRPFDRRSYYFDRTFSEDLYWHPRLFPTVESHAENRMIVTLDVQYRVSKYAALMTDRVADLHLCSSDSHQCFPFYVYGEGGAERRENITDWSLGKFREHYRDDSIEKWDIFYYCYALLHHVRYQEKYADNLKRDLPRVPFMEDFRTFSRAGKQLSDLHVFYEQVEPWPLEWECPQGKAISYRVEKMVLSRDSSSLLVNNTLSLRGIPPRTFDYRLGNRSALEWVIAQHRITTDKRTGITSDPNRKDDPEYIVRLVERVVRLSVETVRIVNGLPSL